MAIEVSSSDECPSYAGWCVLEWQDVEFVPVEEECVSGYGCVTGPVEEKDRENLWNGYRAIVCCESSG